MATHMLCKPSLYVQGSAKAFYGFFSVIGSCGLMLFLKGLRVLHQTENHVSRRRCRQNKKTIGRIWLFSGGYFVCMWISRKFNFGNVLRRRKERKRAVAVLCCILHNPNAWVYFPFFPLLFHGSCVREYTGALGDGNGGPHCWLYFG